MLDHVECVSYPGVPVCSQFSEMGTGAKVCLTQGRMQ